MKRVNKEELHDIFNGIKDGNELEFNKLYEKYKELIYGIAFSILKNKEDSEEIVQSIFIKIFKLEKEKLPKSKEASWLYTITKNEVIDFLRNKKKEISLDEIYYITNEQNEINDIIDKETYNKIIQKLNTNEQEIVSLKIISKLSFKEISKILNIPIGTVQWKYYKAIHSLKLLLGNLSMFIITMVVLLMKKGIVKEETIIEEGSKEEITDNAEDKRVDEETKKQETNITEDVIIKEETVVTAERENTGINMKDIGIVSVAGIFFISAMFFLIIFIKHQQNARKKSSK